MLFHISKTAESVRVYLEKDLPEGYEVNKLYHIITLHPGASIRGIQIWTVFWGPVAS